MFAAAIKPAPFKEMLRVGARAARPTMTTSGASGPSACNVVQAAAARNMGSGPSKMQNLSVSVRTSPRWTGNYSVLNGGANSYVPITRSWGLVPPQEAELMQLAAASVRRAAARVGKDMHACPLL